MQKIKLKNCNVSNLFEIRTLHADLSEHVGLGIQTALKACKAPVCIETKISLCIFLYHVIM